MLLAATLLSGAGAVLGEAAFCVLLVAAPEAALSGTATLMLTMKKANPAPDKTSSLRIAYLWASTPHLIGLSARLKAILPSRIR